MTIEAHNEQMRRQARGQEIARSLAGAIEQAAEALAELGLTSDEAGEFITDTFVGCDWADYFEED